MIPKIVIALLLASAIGLQAAPRLWKTNNGQRSVSGEFIKRDATTITIRYDDGKELTSPLANLHPVDLNWVNMMHPLPDPTAAAPPTPGTTVRGTTVRGTTVRGTTVRGTTTPGKTAPDKSLTDKTVPNQAAVFDQLVFGDTRDRVFTKLKTSKFVELTVDETFLGRTGLNGIFRTRKQIGGLDASLFFDWTDEGHLKELTLQTETLPASAYRTKIEPSWKQFIVLLTTLYDQPVQNGSLPYPDSINDGTFSPSHLWTLETGGSVLLGTARDGDQFQLVVRFTQKKIKPVAFP